MEKTLTGIVEQLHDPGPRGASQEPGPESVYDLLSRQAREHGGKAAIGAPGRKAMTYAELLRQVDYTAAALRDLGLQRDEAVAVVLPNGPEMATSFLGVCCATICAPLNPAYRLEEFDFYLSDLEAKALIVPAGTEGPAVEAARKRNIRVVELVTLREETAGSFELAGAGRVQSTGPTAGPQDVALVLHTSGTTSRPKIVPLTHANLCASGRNVSHTLRLTPADRCLNVMPLFHIHGLVAALLASLTAGASVLCTPGFDSLKFFEWVDEGVPSWYTAVPTVHQAVLAAAPSHRDVIARRPLRFVRSSSAALPPKTMQQLEDAFQTKVVEAYGMTEAAHQMTSNPIEGRRKPGSVGVAAGPAVAVMDDAGNLVAMGQIGEVVIAGPNVTAGYLSNEKANASAFTNGWFRTGDQGRFDADGYLFLTGRLKEIINRGGEKIAPREIDDVLTQHPAVAQAVAFALPHPTLGEEVAAAVVLKAGSTATEGELRRFASEKLADFKVPKQVLLLDQIPKGATGKVQRIGLAEKLAAQLEAKKQTDFVAGSNPLEEELIGIWRRVLRADRVGARDDFHALGGDSLAMTTMLHEVEERFQVPVSVDAFLNQATVEGLAALLAPREAAADQAMAVPNGGGVKDSFLGGMRNRLFQLLALYAPGYTTTRVWLHRKRGVSIGQNVSIGLSTIIETAYPRLVSIGDNVSIGMRCLIIGHLRDSTDQARNNNRHTVRLEDGAYIGPGVIILPHVTVGAGAVVSAGSVLTRSVPPHTLVQGNPAKAIARCGVSLGGGVSYEQFIRNLKPLEDEAPEAR